LPTSQDGGAKVLKAGNGRGVTTVGDVNQ